MFVDANNTHKHQLSKTINKAMEAGHVRIDRPAIIEVDTTRAIADGNTIFRAGKSVFLTTDMPSDYLYWLVNFPVFCSF